MKNNNVKNKFKNIDNIIDSFDSFDNFIIQKKKKNQLFSKDLPPFHLVKKILIELINKDITEFGFYQFSLMNLKNKNIMEKINKYIPELKKYYLKCKHNKYLENLNEKKIITIFRQLLKIYDYTLFTQEKYDNGIKYLLYTIKKNNPTIVKINSLLNFE